MRPLSHLINTRTCSINTPLHLIINNLTKLKTIQIAYNTKAITIYISHNEAFQLYYLTHSSRYEMELRHDL